MPSALFICDPNWSTGNIVKGLQVTLRDWDIDVHDWRELYFSSAHDVVVALSITVPARNPHLCTLRIATVLCGPGEMELPEVLALSLPPGCVMAGVSHECAALVQSAFTVAHVHTTPGFAHPDIFTWRDRTGPICRAGFVGRSTTQNMQVSGPAKRPEMFSEICERAGVEAVFSEHKYRYEDMQQFYDSVDIVISTSTQEGGPFSPIEAIACGVPALSTDVGIIRDMALPGRFHAVSEAVKLVPHARDFLIDQYEITAAHANNAISAWRRFLVNAATVRAALSAG
jgi:glycosyltransferase involved in cell wall biosynthesis